MVSMVSRYESGHRINEALLEVFRAFSPHVGSWETRVYDWSHDLSKLPESPVLTRYPGSPVAIRVRNNESDPDERGVEIALSWRHWKREENFTCTRLGWTYPTLVYRIDSGILTECLVTSDQSREFGAGSPDFSDFRERFYFGNYKRFPLSVCRELVEIGRVLAQDLNLDICIPDATQSARSR